MAIYDTGTASLAANGSVTGVGTQWTMPLTLIRVGATIIFKTNPLKIYTISEITSDTSLDVYNPKREIVPAGTGYAILAHDGISVQGLAQDVAETLRYYQSKETSIQGLLDFIGQDSFDWARFEKLANQSVTGAADALASQIAAAESAATAVSARNTTTAARDETIAAINSAGDAGTLVALSKKGIGGVTPFLSSLDWDTFNFESGARYICPISSMTNTPEVITSTYPESSTCVIEVKSSRGLNAQKNIQVSTNTSSDNAYRVIDINQTVVGGVRHYTSREALYVASGSEIGGASAHRVRGLLDVYSKGETFLKSSNLSDIPNKGAARENLELGDNSNVKHASIRLNGGESIALNAIESNELTISNTPLGVDNWVGMTMHRWYDDWTRAGLVRDAGAHVSDYRIHVWKSGDGEALFRFTSDQRLISGNSGNTSVNEFQKAPLSDRDLKKEIQYTDGEESYNRVRQWRPAMFKYKDSDVQRHGLIAQDLARIDQEYVHLLPGHAIYEDIKGVDEEGNEVVVDRKEIGYTDDVLSLDSNVLLMDLCAAFVYNSNKVSDLEKEVEELKAIVSELNSK